MVGVYIEASHRIIAKIDARFAKENAQVWSSCSSHSERGPPDGYTRKMVTPLVGIDPEGNENVRVAFNILDANRTCRPLTLKCHHFRCEKWI
jgi:hypothetical protein